MKYNFIVSAYRKAWIHGAKRLFLTEPYVHHVLEKSNEIKAYDEIEIAPCPRQSREDFIRDHNFVDHKYHKYVPILASRLNEIHRTDYEVFFWKKCFSLALIRYITFLYDMFQICEKHFDPDIHNCKVLSKESYYTPTDFDDHRQFFQNTDYGQEQMFSIYMHLFFPGSFNTFNDVYRVDSQNSNNRPASLSSYIDRLFRILTAPNLFKKLLWKFYSFRRPQVGILQSYFSRENFHHLVLETKGKINDIPLKNEFDMGDKIDKAKRGQLTLGTNECDKFDRLFFESLKYCFPRVFIEGFKQVFSSYTRNFATNKNLKYVVSEAWIGNTYSSIALAILQKNGVKHIYNEHNFLSHQFLGNNHKYIIPLVDSFVTLGWENPDIPNLLKGASLFEWSLDGHYPKQHNILFITSVPSVHPPEVNAAYGESGAKNVTGYFEFNRLFFEALDESTKKQMVVRGYPESKIRKWTAYDQYYKLGEQLGQCKQIDNTSPSAKKLMQRSRLIIVNYLSTAYIEALIANIPVVFFWNPDSYYLEDKYGDFFEGLLKVGICQTDPLEAALFVEKIKDTPEEWWSSLLVQKAKNAFLAQNIGNPKDMISYLVNLSLNTHDDS